jgi:FKBP-type peptidyl-prolyl cis-trans isomerase
MMTQRMLHALLVLMGLALGCATGAGEPPAPRKAEPLPAQKVGETIRTKSGLQYTLLRDGFGDRPGARSKVRVHYEGKLANGKVFDSSLERGAAATFSLRQVIPCWTEGIQLMQSGSKARLVCPAKIAYGDKGSPPAIPPNATLTFEVELLDVL